MREPVTPYAHINFKLHILKRMTLKMKLRVVMGLGVMANKWRIRIIIVLKAIASKVMKLKLRIHLDCRNQLLDTKGKFKQYLGPNSMFWTLFFFSFFLNSFFLFNKHNNSHFPHTCFLPYINQKKFNLNHVLLCFKNKGMDGPKLG